MTLEGPVLLKNNGLLPLKSSGKTIIVLGPNAANARGIVAVKYN